MALWNKVKSGFDTEEETVNFGTRTIAESNGSLYETSTIATIQSDGKVTEEPNVLASVQYSRVCVAIDKSITIFENETCEEILLSVSFGLLITCYCVSHDGVFLFVILSNGMLYCLHLLNKGQIIFSKNITKNEDTIITIFLQNESDECINIYLIAKSGAIYRISKFNIKLIQSAIITETDDTFNDTLKKLTQQVTCVQLFKGFSYNEVVYATVGMINKGVSIAMLSSNMLFMWPSEQYNNFNTLNYTKVKFFRNYIAMLGLRIDHTLCLICPQTLLSVKMFFKSVLDFIIIENNDNSLCQILVLTTSGNICTTYTLHVLSFPDFQEKFQINVPIITSLVEIMDPCDEIILYLEGINNLNSGTKYIDTIRVKIISESIPEYQLQRLLRREQFDEAEAFAKKFDLCTEPIYCAKAALLLSQFGPWAKERSGSSTQLDMLLSILDKIENVQYIVECCSKALIPDYKQMRKVHLYAHSRITENIAGEMEAATLIWTRHLPDIIKHVSVETIKDIFAVLPEKIAPFTLWPWLSHFIPTVLSFIPNAMHEIILWSCKKVKSFEQFYNSEWPQIGIDFTNKFIKLLKFEESHQSLYFHQECLNKDSNLKQLLFLMQAMSDIQNLKVNYRLTMFLDSYIGDPMEVSYVLLDKIHVDIIPNFVNTFLNQYMLNNSLQNDYVLSTYIQKTMRNSKSWWSGEEAPWEIRVVAIIDLIQNIETKLQQILEVLKKATVPWSSSIITLAERSSNFDHSLTSQIRIEYNYVPIKLVLKKYGYERTGINNKLIHRIIRKNYDSMISDIQQITKNDLLLRRKAFSSCINYYLSRGNFESVMKILNCLEDEVLLYCCLQIVNYTTASLSLKTIPASLIHYSEMLGWVKLQLEKLSEKCKMQSHYCKNVINSINEITSMYHLKKIFQLNVTFRKYQIEKKQVLQNYIEKLYNGDENLFIIYKKVIKVADLLKLQRIDAISLLLEWTKNMDLLNYFVRCDEGQLNLMTDEYIAVIIQNLCSSALCVCLDDELQSMLLLYSWVNLYQECSNKNLKYGCSTVSNIKQPLEEFFDKMKKVEHNDYCLLQIIKTLYFNSCVMPDINNTLLIKIKSVYFHLLITLLKKIISTRTFDLQLSLSCLFMLSDSEACKWISISSKSFQLDCTRHFRITMLGCEYFHLIKNETLLKIFESNKALHFWAQKLSKYSVSYKEILTSDTTTKREILQRTMNYNDDMVSLFQEFCLDFGFDIQDCLLLYLKTVVITWNPKLNINNLNGKKELHIDEDEVNELRRKCNVITAHIVDKIALKNCITTVYIFNYYSKRKYCNCFSQPTQIECDEWTHLHPGYTSLPPIAEWRLPFLPKVELWKLINIYFFLAPELNLKTYEKWLDIAPILKIQPHIICTLAIKGEILRAWGNKHKTDKWSLCSKNSSLLSDIKKCIERMTGPDALYYGTAALYYVVNHTPPGADQVAAVEECYKYAQLSAQESTFEEGMLQKIKFKYLRFTSEHILYTHGLGNKDYLSFIENPYKLVRELYADESIPQRYRCVTDHRPDINSAVNSISLLFSINVVKLRMELLQEWLQPDIKYVKFNHSVTETLSVTTNSELNLNYDDNLLRACYIMEHGNVELSANFLINMGFGDTNEDYSPEVRYRALHVLQSIIDTAKLEDLTKRDYQTISNYMKSLKYIGKLELLGIGYSINTFETCSKLELIQILWKTQSYSSQALIIIAQLCIDFEIHEYSLWDQNLTKLAKLLMVNELKKILPQVRNISIIVNSNGYLLGWEVIILEPFRKMDIYPTSEQIDNCIEALHFLYSCPVVHMLNFYDIIKYCFECQQPHLALAFLPFLS
ncbi:Kinetochore-associated protein 1 [Habropoda laboriosa]|uniref:Kinetochore-associated protein 1 n=1 Tax=Habropoda laboriosa TaxID=597456 RepID=A0A0L7QPG1_9HYME|nr:Kinetochore-associated protein 1 [Habropoda laboriosa]